VIGSRKEENQNKQKPRGTEHKLATMEISTILRMSWAMVKQQDRIFLWVSKESKVP